MAIEYRLTLAGAIPLEQVADLAAPDATEEAPLPGSERLLTADLNDQYGYVVSVHAGRGGYYDAEDDDGSQWEWEPETYVNITFRMKKNEPSEEGTRNMVATVARVLAGRPEDAALTLDGNWLLLTRTDGKVRKSRRTWWDTYNVHDLIPQSTT
ncbi:SitI3 family protein [Plantactinospora sp. CA-290183]|uniref:SitI3 family protein n=1 Tax=Plantactinospora sp. CA-290183 TaxID=3240006 RepID=UPI003D8FD16D